MLTYEEAIIKLREDKVFSKRMYDSYLDGNLLSSTLRFKNSLEFKETLKWINTYKKEGQFLEIGAGTGFASASFASAGFKVTAIEPNPSSIVGNKAIAQTRRIIKTRINIIQSIGEILPFRSNSFDIVYFRQCLHHISNPAKCLSEVQRVLRPHGLLTVVREHVVSNNRQLNTFLNNHPLHKLCGGENAYTLKTYKKLMLTNGFKILKVIRPFESELNYYPFTYTDLITIGLSLVRLNLLHNLFINKFAEKIILNALNIFLRLPGRNYSFIAVKDSLNN